MSLTKKILIGIGAFIALIIILAVATSGHSGTKTSNTSQPTATASALPVAPPPTVQAPSPPATQAPPPPPPTTQAPDTVTYEITGNAPAGVVQPSFTYGPDGSTSTGYVGLDKTVNIPANNPPAFYAINGQLSDAGGSITVKILVDGHVVSQGNATGADNIATAEIVQDPMTGQWQDTNAAG